MILEAVYPLPSSRTHKCMQPDAASEESSLLVVSWALPAAYKGLSQSFYLDLHGAGRQGRDLFLHAKSAMPGYMVVPLRRGRC